MDEHEVELVIHLHDPVHDFTDIVAAAACPVIQLFGKNTDQRTKVFCRHIPHAITEA